MLKAKTDRELRGKAMLALADRLPHFLIRKGTGGIEAYLLRLRYPLPPEDENTIVNALSPDPPSIRAFWLYHARREEVQPSRGCSYFFISIGKGRKSAGALALPSGKKDEPLSKTAVQSALLRARIAGVSSSGNILS